MRFLLATVLALGLTQSAFPPNSTVTGNSALSGGPVGPAAPTYVHDKDCHVSSATSPQTCTFGTNVTAGNAVLVVIAWTFPAGSTISSVANVTPTDTYTNTAWATGANNCQLANAYDMRLYWAPNSAGGANASAIQITWGASPGFIDIHMVEVNGANVSTPIDKADCQHNASSTTANAPSITTTNTRGDFVYGAASDTNTNNRTWTASGAFTLRGTTGSYFASESQSQSAAGAITAGFTINIADSTNVASVGVKP